MSRDWQLYIDDMIACCHKIQEYTKDTNYDLFITQSMAYEAVLRNLEIVGEAAKHVPQEIKVRYPQIEWRKVAGLRDILAHFYFGLEDETIWDIIQNKIPQLLENLKKIAQ